MKEKAYFPLVVLAFGIKCKSIRRPSQVLIIPDYARLASDMNVGAVHLSFALLKLPEAV